jgi:hypothetical protein
VARPLGKTAARGYGAAHQRERERLRPSVEAGEAVCTEPICVLERLGATRWIPPGAPWDLAHDRHTGGYHGPAHRRCNRAEGARWKELLRRGIALTQPAPRTKRRPTAADRRWTL